MSYEVLNLSSYVTLAVIDGQTIRFSAREYKVLEKSIVEHKDFEQYPELVIVREIETEIKSQETNEKPEVLVVDDKSKEEGTTKDTIQVEKSKQKRKRSNKSR